MPWGLLGWKGGWAVWRQGLNVELVMMPWNPLWAYHIPLASASLVLILQVCTTRPRLNLFHLYFSVTPLDFSSTLWSSWDKYLYYPIKVTEGLRLSSVTERSPSVYRVPWSVLNSKMDAVESDLVGFQKPSHRPLLSSLFFLLHLSVLNCLSCCYL